MKLKKRYTLIPFILITTSYFIYFSYSGLKKLSIQRYNAQQKIVLNQTIIGIDIFFNSLLTNANYLANLNSVCYLSENGKQTMKNFYINHSHILKAITRVNEKGIITYTCPQTNAIGKDISNQKHIASIIRNHKPVLSDVFTTVQGFQAIALHVPVFDSNKQFKGSIAFVIDFTAFAETFLSHLNTKGKHFSLLLSEKGIELYCVNKEHIGKTLQHNMKNSPSMINLYETKIKKMKTGTGSFIFPKRVGKQTYKITDQVVFSTITLLNTNWKLIITTPEQVILAPIFILRNKMLFVVFALLILLSIFIFLSAKESIEYVELKKRMEMEERLSKSELNLQMILEKTPVGIAVTNEYNNPAFINSKFTETFGYCLDDVKTLEIWEKQAYPEKEYRQFISKAWQNGIKKSKKDKIAVNMKGVKIKCKNGETKIVEVTVYAIEGKTISVFVDETEKVLTAEKNKVLKEQLARSKKMEALGLLASGVAHDLNNILSGVVTLPEIIINRLGTDNPCTQKLQLIQKSGEKAAAVVTDLLTIARGVASKKEVIAIDSIVLDYLDSPEFEKLKKNYPNVRLKTNLTVKDKYIWGSDIHIRKSLMNLVTNAFETLEEQGTVTINTKTKHFESDFLGYQTIPKGDYIVLEVTDTGKGMTKEVMERIFEPFFTRKQMGMSGTGLGLAIVWNTMQNHNGYINLKSTIGIGTSFELYFPLSHKVLKETNRQSDLSNLKGNKETILIVDDEEIQRTIAMEILSDLNYKPIAVSSGEEAVNKVKKAKFDLILLDMIMPNGISGKITYEKINEISPKQKAIVITGLSSSEDAEATLKMGASSLLTKPYSMRELALAVKNALEKE